MKLTDIPVDQRPHKVYDLYTSTPGMTVRQVATLLSCHERTIYRHLSSYHKKNKVKKGKAKREPPVPDPVPTSHNPGLLPAPSASQILKELLPSRRPGTLHVTPSLNRSCVLDIEASDFSATGLTGFLICAVILPLGSDQPVILALEHGEQHGDDKRVLVETIRLLTQFDNIIGHYVLGYDLPWLYTRADVHGLPPMRGWAVLDTYYLARDQKLKTIRKSQAFLLDHFGLENLKTSVYPRLWNDVRSSDEILFKYSRNAIVDHCVKDVVGNRLIFDRLWPKAFATGRCPYRMTYWKGAAYNGTETNEAA